MEKITINRKILVAEEVETCINVDHFNQVFHIYTSCVKTSKMLLKQFPEYYVLSDDKVSATCDNVPISLFRLISATGIRGQL